MTAIDRQCGVAAVHSESCLGNHQTRHRLDYTDIAKARAAQCCCPTLLLGALLFKRYDDPTTALILNRGMMCEAGPKNHHYNLQRLIYCVVASRSSMNILL